MKSKAWTEKVMQGVFFIAACTSVLAVALICIFLFANGIPAIRQIGFVKFITGDIWRPGNELFGIFPMIIGSIYVTAGAIIFGVPIGILTSVFMAMYCPKKIYRPLKAATELLAGIPSVVYGFFGMVIVVPIIRDFGRTLKMMGLVEKSGDGKGILTTSIVLGMMILPTIIGTTESAMRAVPPQYYEGSLALGATQERSIFKVVIPAAKSGVITGIVLGIGRAIGETMAVIMIAGNQPRLVNNILLGVRTLTGNIVIEMGYATGLHREALIATGVVLFVFILIINFSVALLKRRGEHEYQMKKPVGVNRENFADKVKSYLRHPGSMILMLLVMIAAFITFALLLFLIFYILVNGIPYIKPSLFSLHYTSENASVIPALINTVVMTLLSLLIAVPFGIFSAIFLVEYAGKGNKFIEVIRLTTETLSGIPSIVYGLFGMLFFVNTLKWGFSVLAGAFTLSIMILPLIMRQTEEALKAVPDSYREGSFGLGAGKLRTVFRIVLPSAVPGILAGVILAIGRIVGETAALIYTAGTVAQVPKNVLGSGRTLAIHMYMLSSEGLYMNQAYATAVILLVLVVAINTLSGVVAKKLTKA